MKKYVQVFAVKNWIMVGSDSWGSAELVNLGGDDAKGVINLDGAT